MLVVMHGSLLGMTYAINNEALVVGRTANLDNPIDDDNVSRRHAEIFREGDCVKLRDLDSTNGTFVNSQRVKESVLCDGDMILIGKVLFKFIRSSSIENRFFGQMFALATTDFLTGIFNRQHIMSRSVHVLRSVWSCTRARRDPRCSGRRPTATSTHVAASSSLASPLPLERDA